MAVNVHNIAISPKTVLTIWSLKLLEDIFFFFILINKVRIIIAIKDLKKIISITGCFNKENFTNKAIKEKKNAAQII